MLGQSSDATWLLYVLVLVVLVVALIRIVSWLNGNPADEPPRPTSNRRSAELRDLNVTARQVQILADMGLLEIETEQRVLDSVAVRKAQLLDADEVPAPLYRAVPQRETQPLLEPPPRLNPAPARAEPVAIVPLPEEKEPLVAATVPPRRRLADVLTGFMEEKNILWGELVGGLLIVGCSIALVISLWQTLERIPYFPFVVVSSISLAVFGAGQYTLHHWKLESTSRGLLVIASLLVPLNLVVLAGLARGQEGGLIEIAVSMAALGVFTWMIHTVSKGQIGAGWTLPLAVVGTTAPPLALPWLPENAVFWVPVVLGCGGVACFASGVALRFRKLPASGELEQKQAEPFYIFLGLSGFAAAVSLAFFASQGVRMALPLSLAAAPIVAVGLLLHRRLPCHAGMARTGVTGIALLGMLAMLATPVLAWTYPLSLLLVCLLNAAMLTVFAFRLSAPFAHAAALPFLGLAAITAFHLLAGHLEPAAMPAEDVLRALLASESSVVLTVLAILLALTAEALVRLGRSEHAVYQALGGLGIGGLALLLASLCGLDEPGWGAIVFLAQGTVLLAANVRWRLLALSYVGYGLLLGGTLWLLAWSCPEDVIVWVFVLACEALASALLAAWRGHNGQLSGTGTPIERDRGHWSDSLTAPCHWMTLVSAGVSILVALTANPGMEGEQYTVAAFLLSGAMLLWAWVTGWRGGTWAGASLLWVGLTHLFVVDLPSGWLALPWLTALLLTATLLLLARILLRWVIPVEPIDELSNAGHWFGWRVRHVFSRPTRLAAIVTTLLALSGCLFATAHLTALGLHLGWLAALWLALAWTDRSAGWLTGAQAVLSASVAVLTTAWVREQGWALSLKAIDLRALQAFGVTLSLLGLLWIVVRRALRPSLAARALFEPPWPPFDRVMLVLLPLGTLLLAVWGVMPGLQRELFTGALGARVDAHLYGPGAWLLLGVLAVLLTAAIWDRDRDFAVPGLMLLGLTLPFLSAAQMDETLSSATGLRWGLGAALLVLSLPFWARGWLSPSRTPSLSGWVVPLTRGLLLSITVGGILLLTAEVARLGFSGVTPAGPLAGTVFALLGWTAANIVPLMLACVGLAGHGVRERESGYLFAGGVVAWLSVTGGYALSVVTSGDALTLAHQVRLWQFGCLASALWAGLWLTYARFDRSVAGVLLGVQSLLGLAVFALLAMAPVLVMLGTEGRFSSYPFGVFAGPAGWLAWAASLAVAFLFLRQTPQWIADVIGAGGLLLGVLIASLLGGEQETLWPAFHVLLLSWSLLAAVAGGWFVRQPPEDSNTARLALRIEGLAWLLSVFALCAWDSPIRPWPTSGPVLLAALLMGAIAIRRHWPSRVYASGGLIVLASLLAWVALGDDTLAGLLLTFSGSHAASSLVWTAVILALRRQSIDLVGKNAAFAHAAALGALGLLGVAGFLGPSNLFFAWSVWTLVGLAMAALLWDEQAHFAPGGLYGVALAEIVLLLRGAELDPSRFAALVALLLAGLLLAATAVCRLVSRRSAECERLGLASWVHGGPVRDWFVAAQTGVSGVVVLLGLWLTLDAEAWADRLGGAIASALLLLAVVYFASVLSGQRQQLARRVSLLLTPLVLAEASWVLLDPVRLAGILHHTAAIVWALMLCCAVYRQGLRTIPETWREEARRLGTLFGVASAGAFAALVVLELRLYDPVLRRTDLFGIEVALTALAGAGLIALALREALAAPGLGEQLGRRTHFVYAAELLLVLLFVHVRLNVPLMRQATAVQYWPVMVLALAFAGVGLAELFRRRGLHVLAVPLHRTGLFLPLLPLIAFWLRPTPELLEAAGGMAPGLKVLLAPLLYMPEAYSGYALIWFLVSLLLLGIALTRRSFGYALAAAVASNVGLWMMLTHHGLGFLLHPQLWLVPLGLIVLIAEQLNRDELTREQRLALRYAGLLLLYVSSTADMFITGIGNSALMPLALALLAVLGMLAGIVMQVRAFLFVGVLFLLVDVLSMIWHAAVGRAQTWVWYVSGIVLGSVILALFAVFEKRRDDVRHLVEQIKRWD